MFTLKMAWADFDPPSADDSLGRWREFSAWLADVSHVVRLDRLTVWDYDSIHYPDALRSHNHEIDYYCRASRDRPPEWQGDDPFVYLLSVTTPERKFLMVVEKAWLLGPNGDTIERIAP